MKKSIWVLGFLVSVVSVTYVLNASEHEHHEKKYEYDKKGSKSAAVSKYSVSPVTNAFYKEECASCHFAYQPGLLPSKAWIKLMKPKALENHFGTDASLEEDERITLLGYLVKNAADKVPNRLGKKIQRSIAKGNTPIAISKTRYFQHEHDEIPQRLIKQKEVKSIANCIACHTTAGKGYYGERDINIPNYGKWDD